jgi:hypothetical protein
MMDQVASVHVTGAQEHRGTGADEHYVAVETTKVGSADMDKMNADSGLRREGQYQQGGFAKEGGTTTEVAAAHPAATRLAS